MIVANDTLIFMISQSRMMQLSVKGEEAWFNRTTDYLSRACGSLRGRRAAGAVRYGAIAELSIVIVADAMTSTGAAT